MPITPVNRDDGRHWCRPASADPEESPVTCPDCGTVWEHDGVNVWSVVGQSAGTTEDPVLVFEESPGD